MSMDEFAVLPGDLHAVLTLILRDWAGFTMACIDNLPPSISSNFVSPNQAFCWWSLCHTAITYRRLVTCYNFRINFHLSLFTNWFQIEVFISGQPTKEFAAFCHTQKLFISSGNTQDIHHDFIISVMISKVSNTIVGSILPFLLEYHSEYLKCWSVVEQWTSLGRRYWLIFISNIHHTKRV